MTEPGLIRTFAFINGVWSTAEISEETVHAWRLKLQRFDDDRVMAVLFALAETERFLPALSQVYQGCVDAGRTAALANAPERRELPAFGTDPTHPHDRRWSALAPEEQNHWLTEARGYWPEWLKIRADSPLLMAHAAALQRAASRR